MEVKPALALPEGLEVIALAVMENVLTVTVVATQVRPACPLCGMPAVRVHSRYTRRVADLPCGGQQVHLLLHVRKYFCDVLTCARKIFVERLIPFVAVFARVTVRLSQLVQIIGLATGGRLGVRVTDRLGIQTSRQTILRRIMALPAEPVGLVIELGIDDFSFKRGRTFGTLLVDLQSRAVIDVLPDRKAETSAAWMTAHPEIELVSRDRGGDYVSAAATGAPQAVQCADRFHVLKNLGGALEGLLARHLAAHRNSVAEQPWATPLSNAHSKQPPKRSLKAAELSRTKRGERLARYQHVVALHKQGVSQTVIADRVGVGHATVSRWLAEARVSRTTTAPPQDRS